jgi:hypothetical protein
MIYRNGLRLKTQKNKASLTMTRENVGKNDTRRVGNPRSSSKNAGPTL